MTQWSLPNQKREQVNANLRRLERSVTAHDNTCMFVIAKSGERCGLPAVKGHSIPRKPVLTRLGTSSNDLLEFRWGISPWISVFNENSAVDLSSQKAFGPSKVRISEASVGHFACSDHEQKFRPIDVAEFNIYDNRTPILTAYRIALLVNDQWRKYVTFLSPSVQIGLRNSSNYRARIEWYRISEKRRQTSVLLGSHLEKLGKVWHRGAVSYTDAEAHLIEFRSGLRFAAAVMFGPIGLYVTVFPGENDWHSMLVSYHKDDKQAVCEAIESLNNLARVSALDGTYGVEIVEKLLSDGFGSVIASAQSYKGLPERQREALQEVVHKSSQATLVDQLLQSRSQPVSAVMTRNTSRRVHRFMRR